MNREQKLIDIMFQVGLMIHNPGTGRDDEPITFFNSATKEEVAGWIAEQLRACGFDTEPRGMSWGVLKNV